MNNRLKFRIYIPNLKRFEYFDLNNFEFSDLSKFHYSGRNLHSKEYPIQQYTGLNDINGNPIFEGDIVKFDDSEISEKPTIGIAEVIWTNDLTIVNAPSYGLWFISNIFNNKTGFYGHILGRIEVIGNIFNPPCRLDVNLECLECDNLIDDCPFKNNNKS